MKVVNTSEFGVLFQTRCLSKWDIAGSGWLAARAVRHFIYADNFFSIGLRALKPLISSSYR